MHEKKRTVNQGLQRYTVFWCMLQKIFCSFSCVWKGIAVTLNWTCL